MRISILVWLIFSSFSVLAKLDTSCHTWPMSEAKRWLQNRNIVSIADLNENRTLFRLLASERLKKGQYTDIYFFSFFDKNGKEYDLITQNISSEGQCSEPSHKVKIYTISTFNINY